jgi:hypothetical protein
MVIVLTMSARVYVTASVMVAPWRFVSAYIEPMFQNKCSKWGR